MTKQIEALKMVIDFLNREGFIEEHEIQNVIETCKEALAEAEKQEPVAWMYEDELPDNYPYETMFQYSAIRNGVRMFPVFHPSTWQSLSDDEIEKLLFNNEGFFEFARAIEQALKEKNYEN